MSSVSGDPAPSTSPPPSNASEESTPEEFLCPVSRRLMEDPVIVPTGHTFERSCIEACKALGHTPPLLHPIELPWVPLIPNLSLKRAIARWCDGPGRPSPSPLSQEAARSLVQGLKNGIISTADDVPPSEEIIFRDLANPAARESALDALLQQAKAGSVSVCTPRIAASIALIMHSNQCRTLIKACKAVLALSETQANRIKIAFSGAVSPLLHLLAHGTIMGCRIGAAGTLWNLADEDRNRAIMGGLGAIPTLLESFFDPPLSPVARIAAAMAILSLDLCPDNLAILADTTAVVPRLVCMTADRSSSEAGLLRPFAMNLLADLAADAKSREAMIKEGAVRLMVKMVREERGLMDTFCSSLLYDMWVNSSPEFMRLAVAAGAELAASTERWRQSRTVIADAVVKAIRGNHQAVIPDFANWRGSSKVGYLHAVRCLLALAN